MTLLEKFASALLPLVPAGVTLCIVILVVFFVRYIIDKRTLGTGKNVRRQVLTILLSFAGLLILIISIPDQYFKRSGHRTAVKPDRHHLERRYRTVVSDLNRQCYGRVDATFG